MRGIGWMELIVISVVGILCLLLPAAIIGAVVWFVTKRRPTVSQGSRTCSHCGQRVPDIGSFCAFCGQKIGG